MGYTTYPYPPPSGEGSRVGSGPSDRNHDSGAQHSSYSTPLQTPTLLGEYGGAMASARPWIPQSSVFPQGYADMPWSEPSHGLVPNIYEVPPPAETSLSAADVGLGYPAWGEVKGKSRESDDEWMNEDLGREFKRRILGEVVDVDLNRETAQLRTLLNELINLLQPFDDDNSAPLPSPSPLQLQASSPPPPYLHTRFTRLSSLVLSVLQNLGPHVHPHLAPAFATPFDFPQGTEDRRARTKKFEDMTPAEKEMEVIRKRRDALIAKAAAAAAAAAGAPPTGGVGALGNRNPSGSGSASGGGTASSSPKVHSKRNLLPTPGPGHGPGHDHGLGSSFNSARRSPLSQPPIPSYDYGAISLGPPSHGPGHTHTHSPLGNLAALTEASDLVSHSQSNANGYPHERENSSDNGNSNVNGYSFFSDTTAYPDPNSEPDMNASTTTSINLTMTGRCHGCGSSVTSEWMRGPDGPGSLCDSCGMHYAKLLAKKDIPISTPQITFDQLGYFFAVDPIPIPMGDIDGLSSDHNGNGNGNGNGGDVGAGAGAVNIFPEFGSGLGVVDVGVGVGGGGASPQGGHGVIV